MKILGIAGWSAASALAVFFALSSFAVSQQGREPARVALLGVPPTAVARGNLALKAYAARLAANPETTVSPWEKRLALSAYRTEPLSVASLGVLALSAKAKGDEEAAYALFSNAGKLTRRSRLVTSQMIEATGRRGDEQDFFVWLSRAILTDQRMRSTYVSAMAEATSRDNSVATLAPVVGPNPSWAEFYWRTVANRPNSLVNAAKLRLAILKAPWRQTEIRSGDPELVAGLIKAQQFEAAIGLAEGLGQIAPREAGSGNRLINGDFARAPTLPAVDWQLAASGALGSSIAEANKGLLVSAIGGARGVAARQLVPLSGGRYTIAWKASGSAAAGDPTLLSASLSCAERGQAPIAVAPVRLSAGSHEQAVAIPATSCRWFWFSIEAALPDDAGGMDVTLDRISLTPAGV